ncbi:MAG: hypothetical protein QOJ86_769, partial [Bradyrhizobium sp.]|nr:hypothetical protein [Bradyrhizobium sp.]
RQPLYGRQALATWRGARGRAASATAGVVVWTTAMSLSFLLTSLIVIASPGTGVLYTLASALTKGSRASVAAAFGCTLGIVPHMSAAMLGLAAVLHASALAFLRPEVVWGDLSLVHGVAGAARARGARGRCPA